MLGGKDIEIGKQDLQSLHNSFDLVFVINEEINNNIKIDINTLIIKMFLIKSHLNVNKPLAYLVI